MKQVLLLILFAVFFASTSAQITLDEAVDFTVTDIDGEEHTLFDYLDAGKYVLIDFWATW